MTVVGIVGVAFGVGADAVLMVSVTGSFPGVPNTSVGAAGPWTARS